MLNSPLRFKVRLDGLWTNSTPVQDQTGNHYKVTMDRYYQSAQIYNSSDELVAECSEAASAADLVQAVKNYLIVELGCAFAVDNAERYSHVVLESAAVGASAYTLTAIEPGSTGQAIFSAGGNNSSPVLGNKFGSASIIQTALRTIPGLENVVVTANGVPWWTNGYNIDMSTAGGLVLTIASDTVLGSGGEPINLTLSAVE